ncbi:phosphoenolpyruvate synthase, partial [Patescibacteria group bacterium]|nr:phosphoenolpyruvate synthase [Patescibacteria group bacterium]
MDIEWAKDGKTGKLFIVQARPETISTARDPNVLEEYVLTKKGRLLVDGLAIGSKIGAGRVHVIKDAKGIKKFRPGDVLVTRMTDPDWVPIMKQASAIITDSGGRTSHAAIVSRELGTPAVVGTGKATSVLRNGMPVTVTCAEGDEGRVYAGILPFHVRRVSLKKIKEPKTHVMMNIGDPRRAFEFAQIPSAGIGLARTEFIFTEYIKVHPLALVHFKDLRDPALRKKIEAITAGYDDKKQFLVDRLADGIAHLAAAFYPNDVIVRTSDFKTNEYAALLGGQAYEPVEANPMIGWRGASRYYDPKYKEAFALECKAIKKVREEMGLTNVVVMIPFCRTPEEGRRVLATMKAAGLPQGKNKLRVYVMVEIPSNIIQAEAFADIFDGFSIGSNDLTQLTLGVDRDSEIVRRLYDEHDEAVLASIRSVIRAAKKKKVKIGICGQAPSDDPTFAEFLVREGIDSISLNPDTVLPTRLRIAAMEQKLRRRRSKK